MRQKLSPPKIAKLWGIGPAKVVGWIHSGELPAINVATRPGGRPRYLVDQNDLLAFEAKRRVVPPSRPPPRRRRSSCSDVTEFF
jgi:hypothetical protein